MTIMLRKGRYRARFASNDADVTAAQRLRHLCFVTGAGRVARADGRDADSFDHRCQHVLIEDALGQVAACFRLLLIGSANGIGSSYAAQYYDLERLCRFDGPVLEIGRFCMHPGLRDPDVLRVAWGALARFVDARGVTLLFGCASFSGTDPAAYADCFGLLRAAHLAPQGWMPGIRSAETVLLPTAPPDRRGAMLQTPPLLRTYLGMGGWVSDHAVVDRAMNTLHVFTGVQIAAIPPARARALRAMASQEL